MFFTRYHVYTSRKKGFRRISINFTKLITINSYGKVNLGSTLFYLRKKLLATYPTFASLILQNKLWNLLLLLKKKIEHRFLLLLCGRVLLHHSPTWLCINWSNQVSIFFQLYEWTNFVSTFSLLYAYKFKSICANFFFGMKLKND